MLYVAATRSTLKQLMAVIGILSDSNGDIALFDAAMRLLVSKGARRFLFAGGAYSDVDAWVKFKREEVKARSDYSNNDFLDDVIRYLIGLDQMERPAAFGTAYEASREIEELTRLKTKILRAPERGSLAYQDPSIPKKVVDLLGDVLCCLVHDKNDLIKEDIVNNAVLVHGKEPVPAVVSIGPRFFVCPGRLSDTQRSTVGILEIEKTIAFSAFDLDGAVAFEPQILPLQSRTKISVK
jgi:hypothetical protein